MIDGRMHDASQYVLIPNEEYRELVSAQQEAECIKRILKEKIKHYGGIKHEELEMIGVALGFGTAEEME